MQAQLSGKGTISGTVSDPSGANVPHATVTATNVATDVHTTRTTTSDGYYVLSPLDPGTYNVTVTAQGFKTLTQTRSSSMRCRSWGSTWSCRLVPSQKTVTVTTAPPHWTPETQLSGTP